MWGEVSSFTLQWSCSDATSNKVVALGSSPDVNAKLNVAEKQVAELDRNPNVN